MIGEIIAIIGLGLVLICAIWGIHRERARHKKRMEQIAVQFNVDINLDNLARGEHVTSPFDPIPAGELGVDQDHPHLVAPETMATEGLPYGAWCKCGNCGQVGRSTLVFDFYMSNGLGQPLKCELCAQASLMKGSSDVPSG